MKVYLAAASAMALLFAAPAMANEGDMKEKTSHYMQKIDTNNDGKISKAEHDAFGDKMFTDADTNDNGEITEAELTAAKEKEKAEWKAEKGEKTTR